MFVGQDHPVFERMHASLPAKHGALPAFDKATLANSLAHAGRAICACNITWLDLGVDATLAHIPIKSSKVEKLANSVFKEPRALLSNVHVAVPKSWGDGNKKRLQSWEPMKEKPFRRLSAPEMLHAFVLAVARDVKAGADESTLQAWLKFCLAVPVEFQCLEGDYDFHKARPKRKHDIFWMFVLTLFF